MRPPRKLGSIVATLTGIVLVSAGVVACDRRGASQAPPSAAPAAPVDEEARSSEAPTHVPSEEASTIAVAASEAPVEPVGPCEPTTARSGLASFERARPIASALLASSIDRAVIRRVVQDHNPQLLACYREGLARDPDLEGKITAQWSIKSDGKVGEVELVDTTLADECVVRCVLDEVKTWRFPGYTSTQGPVSISYPFVFRQS